MCGCAMFGCDGMCVDALSNMFRILYAPRLVFEVCLVVFVFVTAILIQRSQRSKDDRVILPSWTKATRVHRSNVSLSAFSLDGFAVSVSNWKQVSLRRATLIRRIMACRARVEKGATRSIATGTANVNVGSSQTDMVAEKIESETCRPSTSMYDTIWYTVPPESKAHRDIVCVVLRQRRSHLVQGPACLLMCGDCMQDQVASPFLKDGAVHVRDYCCAFPWHFQGHPANDAEHAGQIYALIETLTKRPSGVRKLMPLLPQVSAS